MPVMSLSNGHNREGTVKENFMSNKFKDVFKAIFSCLLPSREHMSHPANFILPKFDTCFFVRFAVIVIIAYLFFGFICIPAYVKGGSMEPTYSRVGFNFCWRPTYWFSAAKRGDIVIIRYTGKKLYLKRIIGLAGDTIAFRNGKLFLNGKEINEPYIKKPCDWNLPDRKVDEGKIYVIGDNRSMMMEHHTFGAVKFKRLYGAPVW